jgi:hypothetical protein
MLGFESMKALAVVFLIFQSPIVIASSVEPSPEKILSMKLVDSDLSVRAQRVLQLYIYVAKGRENYTIEDMVRIAKRDWPSNRRKVWIEVAEFLNGYGLRLNMAPHEIAFFRSHGRLPVDGEGVDDSMDIRALPLSALAIVILWTAGVDKVGDYQKTSSSELFQIVGARSSTIKEIEHVFKKIGFPIYKNKRDRICQEKLRPPVAGKG